MRRFIDEIIVEDPELAMDIIRGLESPREEDINHREYSVELFEDNRDPLMNPKHPDSNKYRARIRIFTKEVVE